MKDFNAFLGPKGQIAFAIIFLILGILSVAWLIMYQEADPDRTFRGSVARSVASAMFLGMSFFLFFIWSGIIL
jgi:Ca2+/Na+ antiporter